MSSSGGTIGREWARWPLPPLHPTDYAFNNDVVLDGVTGLVWQRVVPAQLFSWAAAADYCDALDLGGAQDWTLPTLMELDTIVDYTVVNPAINQTAFPNTPSEPFSSSTTNPYYLPVIFPRHIDFSDGFVGDDRDRPSRVRCVRSSPAAPGPHYVANPGDDSVSDTLTGLTWQRGVPVPAANLPDAPTHCANGWRLPSVRELLSLSDFTRTGPALDPDTHLMTATLLGDEGLWSSAYAGSGSSGWIVALQFGSTFVAPSTEVFFRVRCVR